MTKDTGLPMPSDLGPPKRSRGEATRELLVSLKSQRKELAGQIGALENQAKETHRGDEAELILMQIDATRLLLNIINTRVKRYE